VPFEEVLRVAVQIGEALEASHRAGVIHRDLKPANVMLAPASVKLLDFGLARLDLGAHRSANRSSCSRLRSSM
jgi:serine/threonine-protein kinase